MNFKTNKTRLIARVMLLVVWGIVFTSCSQRKGLESGFDVGGNEEHPSFSCAYKSNKTEFSINDVTLTFYYGHHFDVELEADYFSYPIFELYFSNDDDMTVLIERREEELVSDRYDAYYHKSVRVFDHSETLTIPQELFTKESGIIWFYISSSNVKENENFGIVSSIAIYYQKDGDKIILSSKEFSECQIIKEIKMFFGM